MQPARAVAALEGGGAVVYRVQEGLVRANGVRVEGLAAVAAEDMRALGGHETRWRFHKRENGNSMHLSPNQSPIT